MVDIDTEEREVTLSSGTTLSADVLVGADGEYGPCRAVVIGQKDRGTPTGLALYECVGLITALRPLKFASADVPTAQSSPVITCRSTSEV